MSFGKLIYIVVFARLRQLSGQIRKDVEDFLSENIGGIRQFHRLIPLLQKPPQERVTPQPPTGQAQAQKYRQQIQLSWVIQKISLFKSK